MLLGESGRSGVGNIDRPRIRASFMLGIKKAIRSYVTVTSTDEVSAVVHVGAMASIFTQQNEGLAVEGSDDGGCSDCDSEGEAHDF